MKQKLAANRKRKLEELDGDFVLSRSRDSLANAVTPSQPVAGGETPVRRPQDEELCERCKALDLDDAFKPHPALSNRSGRELMSLGEIDEQWRDSKCPLCRLFVAVHEPIAKTTRYKNRGHHLRAIDSHFMFYGRSDPKEASFQSSVVLGVFQGATRKTLSIFQLRDGFARGAIAQAPVKSGDTPEGTLDAKLIDPSKIDYVRVQKWIAGCRKLHWRTCPAGATGFPSTRFIDCLTRKIGKIDAQEDYYALSYVWEESDRTDIADESSSIQNCLPAHGVSQTIEDAIIAVKNLGARYIWIDRYCISQDDPLDKNSQISQMDRIYASAVATIVAVSGKQAKPGLPGVSVVPRTPQSHAHISDRLLISTLPHLSFPVQESRWVRRAWTYQEALLSRRCIFFTDRQVYFLCNGMECSEVVGLLPLPRTISPPPEISRTLSLRMFNIHDPGQEQGTIKPAKSGLWEFFNHLRQFRSRRMTFDSDSLNAFRGILATSKFRSFWGVPFAIPIEMRDSELCERIGFARGLWWYPKNKDLADWPEDRGVKDQSSYFHRRLPDFPSWSWTGWTGEIASVYLPQLSIVQDDQRCNQVSEKAFHTDFCFKDTASGEMRALDSFGSLAGDYQQIIPEFRCTLEITTQIYQLRIQSNVTPNPKATAVCSCHPTTTHPGKLDYRTVQAQRAWLCVDHDSDPLFAETLASQLLDCLVLFKGVDGDTRLFIVERKGKGTMAEVVGMLELTEDFFEKSRVKGERRTIELG